MADSWLIIATKVKNRSSSDLAKELFPGAIGGTTGTPAANLGSRFFAFASKLLKSIFSGVRTGNVFATILDTSAAFSTGNIACTRANAAGDTVTFTYGAKTVVLTEATSPSGESQYARGASDTTCAANLAACINAHSILGPLYTALGATGNCGLTSNIPTALLQDIAMTTSDATAFSFTQLTGGNEGAAQFFPAHFDTNAAS